MGELQKKLGQKGEDAVEEYLRKRKYEILERNFSCRFGEIDIVAKDGDELVFIEVKTRRSRGFGEPQEAIDRRKRRRVQRACEYYINKQHCELPYRIDAALVVIDSRGTMRVDYIKYAIEDMDDEYGDMLM